MDILITGVAGFIGSNLAAYLLDQGHSVSGIDNFSYGERRNLEKLFQYRNFTFKEGEMAFAGDMDSLHGEIIVHLASQKIPRYSTALRTLEENSLMCRNVVAKCLEENSKLVYASTSDVYGKNINLPFSEDSDLVLGPPTIKRWSYALSKIYGEQYIIANHEEYGLRFTITRFFGSYGPNQNLTWWGGPQSVFISKAFRNEPLEIHGNGQQTRTFTYIEDTVKGLFSCITDKRSDNEIFNIGNDHVEEITILGLAKLIWEMVNCGSEPKLDFIPYQSFGKYEDVMRRVPCIQKMKKFFGYNPTVGLREGLIKTIEWQKKLIL